MICARCLPQCLHDEQPLGVIELVVKMIYRAARLVFSARTLRLMWFDLVRLRTRLRRFNQKDIVPSHTKLHCGCGTRHIPGWLNVDVANSDYDVDLASGRLPWRSNVFTAVVGEHMIEHLELIQELIPLLHELHRVLKTKGEIWLSCPDIGKICHSYLNHNMLDLLEDRRRRFPDYSLGSIPTQHMINDLFHQCAEPSNRYGFSPLSHELGYHKNLFDLELVKWALEATGFTNVKRVSETELLSAFPDLPTRNDDMQSVYVFAVVG